MKMQVPKALAGRDGTTLSVGVFLAFVFGETLIPIAQYLSDQIVGDGGVVTAKDGIVRPLLVLVFSVVVLEVVLWLMNAVTNNK